MKKYMVVMNVNGKQGAVFFDKITDAEQFRMDIECGVGGRAQVYEWQDETVNECGAYEFIFE